jgi:N-methylhydantoinase B/oxoprolinase/acetone carboxylase alpha subunit
MHYTGGGGGARARKDGLNGVWYLKANCKLESVELIESRAPILVQRQSWQRPSAGAGEYRSGLGIERELVLLSNASASALNDRHKIPPWGVFGGQTGACASHTVIRGAERGNFEEMFGTGSPSKFANVELKAGDRLILASGGGGGYGDPLRREPEAVRRDVEEGYVSVEEALCAYGVILPTDTRAIDSKATDALRASKRAARGN